MKTFKVKQGNKVYIVRAVDSVSAVKKFKDSKIKVDSSIKDINQVLLSNLKQVAQKGDAWWNKWKKLLDMSDKWNSYQWKELRNNDPKKYELIINNKQYAEKEAEALNREWDRAIDALSRDRSFGKPGDYRMDLHSYKSRNDNYPMGNSQRYDEILYGYEQAEKSARAKKGLDSSIKDAYIEEWWGQSGENPNTVARRYGVSVKQLKRNNDQILYRFEGDINKLNRMHSDGYFMSIDMDGNSIKDGNNQLSVPKNLRVGSKIQTRNGTYTIIAIDNNDIATIQYENGRKFKLALYDIIDELDNVYTTKIIK